MSSVKKTDGEWLSVLNWRSATATGKTTLIAEGHKQKKIWEFKFPNGELRCISPEQYNEFAAIHFTANGWVPMSREEFMA